MPKIEVQEKALQRYSTLKPSIMKLADLLPPLKGEVDEANAETGVLKLEFNDTNRPDLWSTAGAGRALRTYYKGWKPEYTFFSAPGQSQPDQGRRVTVEPGLLKLRPYIAAFAVKGPKLDADTLNDLIQTQEKLCWNFGRKRRSIAMGVYRSGLIRYPVRYQAADPDATRFQPLGLDKPLTLRQILKEHPKGQEFGHIVADLPLFPFLTDAQNEVLSFPPVINSSRLGAVEVGDQELFIELTGTDLPGLTLAASIVACDLADSGYTILPVTVDYPYDTAFGRSITFPYYFQEPVEAEIGFINKLLGVNLVGEEAQNALEKMGVATRYANGVLTVLPPYYRNDFLHPVDVAEDVAMGRGLASFDPVSPSDATIGRLTDEELFGRRVRDLMIGMGFQEMIFNYLGSRKDFIERMAIQGEEVVQILNPMTENYEYVRNSIAPNLLEAEAASGNALFPHHLFEVGKVVKVEPSHNEGSLTSNSLGWLSSNADEGFNQINSRVAALFYYLNRNYEVKETLDPRFIPGRAADVFLVKPGQNPTLCGVFGEVHPQVLENWNIGSPCTLGEINLDVLLKV
ncbi:MAG: phenylalanine--tRNA ligase subunit beta [Spirochaetales bacterium]|nr:phenylalanine--tRNA ligase subunit beta [Spirochaetales bacterium]